MVILYNFKNIMMPFFSTCFTWFAGAVFITEFRNVFTAFDRTFTVIHYFHTYIYVEINLVIHFPEANLVEVSCFLDL